jgi:AcrR family transcriptional regulator
VSKGERTKRRIMAGTRKVLAKKGYLGTRIEDIAQAAGVAKGTLYLYFKDKKTLIMEVWKEFLEEGAEEMRLQRRRDDPFLDILGPNVAYARIVFENAGLLRACVQFMFVHPEAFRAWSESTREWLSRVEGAMDRRLGRGRTDETTRVLATYAMSWMLDGILLSVLTLDHPRFRDAVKTPEQVAETLSVLWHRAVYGKDPDPERLDSAKPLLDFHLSPDPNGEANP